MTLYIVPRGTIGIIRGRINNFFNKLEQETKRETKTRMFTQENDGTCFYGILSGAMPNPTTNHVMVLGRFKKYSEGFYCSLMSVIADIHIFNSDKIIGIKPEVCRHEGDVKTAISILEETIKYREMPINPVIVD